MLIGAVIGALAGRFGVMAGTLILLIGAGPMIALFIYESNMASPRDTSSEGMLATIAFILVVPAGITAMIIGWLRR
jgi:hypothetical protein